MYHSVGAVPSSNATPSSAGCDLVAHYHVQNEWQEGANVEVSPPPHILLWFFHLSFQCGSCTHSLAIELIDDRMYGMHSPCKGHRLWRLADSV